MKYQYTPHHVCPISISFNIENDIVTDVEFLGGCNGNLKAISKLVNGMTADQINEMLGGNLCGTKGTSCADQLAKAVMQAKAEQ